MSLNLLFYVMSFTYYNFRNLLTNIFFFGSQWTVTFWVFSIQFLAWLVTLFLRRSASASDLCINHTGQSNFGYNCWSCFIYFLSFASESFLFSKLSILMLQEQKIKEGLYMMGLKGEIFHLSWFITYSIQVDPYICVWLC